MRRSPDYQPELVGQTFGLVVIVSPQITRIDGYRHVSVKCARCERDGLVSLESLTRNRTSGCKYCGVELQSLDEVQRRFGGRYDAIYHRCNHSTNREWHNYGGRGIKCLFKSRREFIEYVQKELPHKDYIGLDIDRKDNDGNYEPGNLRLATRKENLNNRRNTPKKLLAC